MTAAMDAFSTDFGFRDELIDDDFQIDGDTLSPEEDGVHLSAEGSLPHSPEHGVKPKKKSSNSGDNHQSGRIACDNCKKYHSKCSGETPVCAQCVKRKIPCVYSPQKKRGPKSGQLKQLQEQVQLLNEVIRMQRLQLEARGSSDSVQQSTAVALAADAADDGSAAADGKKRRRANGPDVAAGKAFSLSPYIDEYVRIFEEYIQPVCPVREAHQQQHQHQHQQRSSCAERVKSLIQASPVASEVRTAKTLLSMYAMLALGAQVFGNPAHAAEFIGRARQAAQQVFDQPDLQTAVGFDRMAWYYLGAGDLDKGRIYNGLAAQACAALELPRAHDVVVSSLAVRGLLAASLDEKAAAARELLAIGTPAAVGPGATMLIKARLFAWRQAQQAAAAPRPLDADELWPLFARLDELHESGVLPLRKQQITRAMVQGLRAGVYFALGRLADAELCADDATRLAKLVGLNGQYTSFCAVAGIEWSAAVHHQLGSLEMLKDDCHILEAICSKFPVMMDVSRRYRETLSALMQRQLDEQHLRQQHQQQQQQYQQQPAPADAAMLAFRQTTPALRHDLDLLEQMLQQEHQRDAAAAATAAASASASAAGLDVSSSSSIAAPLSPEQLLDPQLTAAVLPPPMLRTGSGSRLLLADSTQQAPLHALTTSFDQLLVDESFTNSVNTGLAPQPENLDVTQIFAL